MTFCECPNPSKKGDESGGFGWNEDKMLVHAGCGNPTEAYWKAVQ